MAEAWILKYLEAISRDNRGRTLLLSCLRGVRNAFFYSAQVRLSDALIVSFITATNRTTFVRNLKQSTLIVLKQTKYLAQFVFLYRLFNGLTRLLTAHAASGSNGEQLKEWQTFGGAALASLLVYRTHSTDDMQLFFFLFARILTGLSRMAAERVYGKEDVTPPSFFYRLMFGAAGGLILWLFEHHSKHLTSNIRSSMRYLYKG